MIITLLTDFGTSDYFVGAMKGAILSVNPLAQLVDITHEIPAHDVQAGAFTLLAAYESFPPQTIHLAVVDPGVGSTRRPLLIATREHIFIGPDNGLLSYVCEGEAAPRVYHVTNENYFRRTVSATFHGRDIFAPVAGALSKGVSPDCFGGLIEDHLRLAPLAPVRDAADDAWSATIIHIDRFGNLITNITRQELAEERIAEGVRLEIGGREINSFRGFYAEEAQKADELFAIWGSAGFLEIAANCASASRLLGAGRGQLVRLKSRKL